METGATLIEHRVHLTRENAERLNLLAKRHHASEDQIVAKAIDLLFDLSGARDSQADRRDIASLSEGALARVWDNEEDAAYDNWQKLYAVSAR